MSLKTLLNPMPLLPMYPASLAFLVDSPIEQMASTFRSAKPTSLFSKTICSRRATMRSVGSAPGAYALSSAFCTSSSTKCTLPE